VGLRLAGDMEATNSLTAEGTERSLRLVSPSMDFVPTKKTPDWSAEASTSVSAGKVEPPVMRHKSPASTSRHITSLKVPVLASNLSTRLVFTSLSSDQRFTSSYKSLSA